MSFSFNASLSGLNANSNALGVVGNNIANANTVGFRSSNVTFMDVFANSYGARLNGAGNSMQIGNGVQVGAVHTNFSQGNFNEAGSPLQAAIQGNGFFVLRNSDGTQAYTRAGDFTVNNQGFLVASNGGHVMGYMAQNGQIPQGARLSDLQIPIGQVLAPNTTTNGTFRMNLNSSAETGSVFHAPMQVHDSLGNERTLDITFTRLANGTFDATGTLDGTAVQLNGGASVNFAFDSSGNPTAPAALSIVPDQTQLDGATLPSIDVNLRQTNPDGSPGAFNITSFAMPSAVASTTQDGYGAGELNGALVDAQGMIYGTFSNGQSRVIGQYALANFNSEEGLGKAGGNMFKETTGSGQAIIGVPGSGSRGLIAGGYVEQSNVNITNEFIDLIEAQRGFQANSRVITTLNQTFQDLLQIV
ncbi:MAG TPA: flagellar hook protein FlgE [Pyrinomonadaceae bacterium]|jgi:flagellar hook protein FlgE|nr:flagellar hook protein FlgE [Pyrinomonadaceae bacterium]